MSDDIFSQPDFSDVIIWDLNTFLFYLEEEAGQVVSPLAAAEDFQNRQTTLSQKDRLHLNKDRIG